MKKIVCILIIVITTTAKQSAQIITTVAGNGIAMSGDAGNGGPATQASLDTPDFITADKFNFLYIADNSDNIIRKVDAATGIISAFAGTSTQGFSGDGGPATAAELNRPFCVRVDTLGNVYIADYGNNRIRKVNTAGIITTIAGSGSTIWNGDGGPATAAGINPSGFVFDNSGNMYIVEQSHIDVRKVTTAGNIYLFAGDSTAGNGFGGDGGPATSALFYSPEGIEIDNQGNLYVLDTYNNCIRKINTAGIINTIAGIGTQQGYSGDGGPATAAKLYHPEGMAIDASGNIYI